MVPYHAPILTFLYVANRGKESTAANNMAAINVQAAAQTLTSAAFLKSAVLIVIGSLLAQVATEYLRNNVRDISMKGGDAVYALVASALALIVLPGKFGRPIALGSTATAVRVVANDYGVV